MAAGFVHTVNRDGRWGNTIEDGDDVAATFETKSEAVAMGRELAKSHSTEHVIHNEDGSIGERNSYGNDPSDRPG